MLVEFALIIFTFGYQYNVIAILYLIFNILFLYVTSFFCNFAQKLDINEDFSFSGLFSDTGLCNCKDSENEFVIALTKRMDVVSVVFWYCQKAKI